MVNYAPYIDGCILGPENAEQAERLVEDTSLPRLGRFADFRKPVPSWKGKVHTPYKKFQTFDPTAFLLAQEGPDCTSFGAWMAYDATRSKEIEKGEKEQYYKRTATEPIYAQRGGNHRGMAPSLAARWLHDFGGVAREKYGNIDLTKYNHSLGASWWRETPKVIVEAAKLHPANFIALCESAEDLVEGLARGLCAFSGGTEGFSSRRDKDGFAKVVTKWNHCMPVLAADARGKRDGFLFWTWGDWNSGGSPDWAGRTGLPPGTFMCDWDIMDRRIRSHKSTWLVGDVTGWKQDEVWGWKFPNEVLG